MVAILATLTSVQKDVEQLLHERDEALALAQRAEAFKAAVATALGLDENASPDVIRVTAAGCSRTAEERDLEWRTAIGTALTTIDPEHDQHGPTWWQGVISRVVNEALEDRDAAKEKASKLRAELDDLAPKWKARADAAEAERDEARKILEAADDQTLVQAAKAWRETAISRVRQEQYAKEQAEALRKQLEAIPGATPATRESAISDAMVRRCLEEAVRHLYAYEQSPAATGGYCPACRAERWDDKHRPDCRGVRVLHDSLLALGYDLTRPYTWPPDIRNAS